MARLRHVSGDPQSLAGEILLVGCVRNEALRLPDFLAHHRVLGVNRFLMVDNASEDNTAALLAEAPDVCLFHADEPYSASHCGIDWLNAVLHDHAVGHWTLILDADELLVFPGYETAGLTDFLSWVEAQGADAVAAPLLDMYPDGPMGALDYRPGDSLRAACPMFDGAGYSMRRIAPDLEVIYRGGPRQRLFWEGRELDYPSPVLFKVPLVKWSADRALTASTHELTGARFAPATGLLLHFKFLRDFRAVAAREAARSEHFLDARQYRAYDWVLAAAPELSAVCDSSVRYRDSRLLVEMGLMKVPFGYPF